MTGPGRPSIGPVRKVRIEPHIWELVVADACDEECSEAEIVRRILTMHYASRIRVG